MLHTVSYSMEETQKQFEQLYDTHADAIFRYLLWRLKERERALELTQEVFMRLWRHLVAGKSLEYEKAFLYIIAKRLFINEIRQDEQHFSLDDEDAGYDDTLPDKTIDVMRDAEHEELWRCIGTLSPGTNELLQLRYKDGLSVQEIAIILGAKENTVSMRLNRALSYLKSRYNIDV